MSKKIFFSVLGVLVFLIAGNLIYSHYNNRVEESNNASQAQDTEQQLNAQLTKACEILDLDIVQKALGQTAERNERADDAAVNNEEIVFSKCVYKTEDKVASLTLRSPRNENGKNLNNQVFDEASKVESVEMITNFGDKAFWNPEFAQLNIYKDGEWYNFEYGSILPSERALAETIEFTEDISEVN